MFEVKKLPFESIQEASHILTMAYPGVGMTPQLYAERIVKRWEDPHLCFYGVFDTEANDALVGAMRYHQFEMNFHGHPISACGIGAVAVALTRKKEHMAFHMLQHFLYTHREAGYPMALLYPFDPGFYKRMGFGYGAPQYQLSLKPAQLPATGCKERVMLLSRIHLQHLLRFYNQQAEATHGLLTKHEIDFDLLFDDESLHIAGYFYEGHLEGYLLFRFLPEHGNFLLNDLQVSQWLWSTPDAFLGLATFLHAQGDQIRHVLVNTQMPDFHFALANAKDSHQQLLGGVWHSTARLGTGVMYRVLDLVALLRPLCNTKAKSIPTSSVEPTIDLGLQLTDSFMPENAGTYVLSLRGQSLLDIKKQDDSTAVTVTLSMDISDFSSLIVGAVSLKTLFSIGLASLSDASHLKDLSAFFEAEQPPICLTAF